MLIVFDRDQVSISLFSTTPKQTLYNEQLLLELHNCLGDSTSSRNQAKYYLGLSTVMSFNPADCK